MKSSVGTNPQELLAAAINSARAGDHEKARRMLRDIVIAVPQDASGWMWLAFVADDVQEKRAALRKALALRPQDMSLKQEFLKLMDVEHVRLAAARGVFISYSRSDELFAVELEEKLTDAGSNIWLDMTAITEDTDWNSQIDQALKRCGVMLMVVSPDAVGDEIAQHERRRFAEAGKIIIPLLYRHTENHGLDLWHPVIDCRTNSQTGIQHLIRLISATSVHQN